MTSLHNGQDPQNADPVRLLVHAFKTIYSIPILTASGIFSRKKESRFCFLFAFTAVLSLLFR